MKLSAAIKKLEKLGTLTKHSTSISETLYESSADVLGRTNDDYSVDFGNGYSIQFGCENRDTDILNSSFVVVFNGIKDYPKNLKTAIAWCA